MALLAMPLANMNVPYFFDFFRTEKTFRKWNDLEIYNEFVQTMREEQNFIAAVEAMLNYFTKMMRRRKVLSSFCF